MHPIRFRSILKLPMLPSTCVLQAGGVPSSLCKMDCDALCGFETRTRGVNEKPFQILDCSAESLSSNALLSLPDLLGHSCLQPRLVQLFRQSAVADVFA